MPPRCQVIIVINLPMSLISISVKFGFPFEIPEGPGTRGTDSWLHDTESDKSFGPGLLFTALHGMQTRSYDEISVRLSVCPSVCQTRAL